MNPGDPKAHQEGCTCPTDLNQRGKGAHTVAQMDPHKIYFVVEEDCPMHGRSSWGSGDAS